jgi:hypothetical protein
MITYNQSGNLAVVKIDDRQYPGILIQGDSFEALIRELRGINKEIKEEEYISARENINDLLLHLISIQNYYEKTILQNNFLIPYQKLV